MQVLKAAWGFPSSGNPLSRVAARAVRHEERDSGARACVADGVGVLDEPYTMATRPARVEHGLGFLHRERAEPHAHGEASPSSAPPPNGTGTMRLRSMKGRSRMKLGRSPHL